MVKARISSTVLLLMIAAMMMGVARPVSTARAGAPADSLLEWEWQAPAYRLTPVSGDDGRTYLRVEVAAEGYVAGGQPGQPSLPVWRKLIALPPVGDFALDLVEVEYETLRLDYPIEPSPAPAAPYPARFASLDDPAWMRDLRLARLTVAPFRYHPALRTLDVLRRLRLRVVQVGGEKWQPRASAAAPLSLDVLNPEGLDAFRAPDLAIGRVKPVAPHTDGDYKVLIPMEGVYALDYATLTAAGLPVGEIDPATLRLIHAGAEAAAQWEGDGDATFESGERLLFYARPELTRYAGYDVYWLSWGGPNGLRMASRAGNPSGLPPVVAWTSARAEKNVEYDSLYAGWNGDRWFWGELRQPDVLSETFVIPLETPAASVGGELMAWLQGSTRDWPDPDHHVRFALNGTVVHDARWEGKTAYTRTMTLPAGLLTAGDNALVLSLPGDLEGDIEAAWVDAITITYGLSAVGQDWARFGGRGTAGAYAVGGFSTGALRVYDVTDPHAPRVVTGWTFANGLLSVGDGGAPSEYLVLSDEWVWTPQAIVAAKPFTDPPAGADYIVIAHPDFIPALTPLVDRRAAHGLRTAVVDVEAIYDHFGDGRMSPEAIRAFLRHAYANWPAPAPLYVLLVGDATYDPRGYRPDSLPTYLPAYLADVDPWLGETASDHRYADLTGDRLPELYLGRLPVNTPAEAAAVADKIIEYETAPQPGDWNKRLLFGADNPSEAGNHHADADQEYNLYAASPYTGVRVYLSETPGAPHLYTQAAQARAALIESLNRGALIYTYFGHSSWHQEAVLETDGYAPLFHLDHIADLQNQGRLPLVLHMTCYTGYYIHRTDATLDESLLRAPDVGAAAVFGASGNGVTADHRVLHHYFYRSIFEDGQAELGAAMQAALVGLYTYGVSYDLIDTYHLFGDPAMRLNVAEGGRPHSIFLPVVLRGGG